MSDFEDELMCNEDDDNNSEDSDSEDSNSEDSDSEDSYSEDSDLVNEYHLVRDVQQILKLMPNKEQDEVQYMLESHQENPSRVQVVLNEFLEQSEEPTKAKARETSPIPVRNKVGNGMKAKNSKKKSSSATDPKGDQGNTE